MGRSRAQGSFSAGPRASGPAGLDSLPAPEAERSAHPLTDLAHSHAVRDAETGLGQTRASGCSTPGYASVVASGPPEFQGRRLLSDRPSEEGDKQNALKRPLQNFIVVRPPQSLHVEGYPYSNFISHQFSKDLGCRGRKLAKMRLDRGSAPAQTSLHAPVSGSEKGQNDAVP